MSRYNVEADGEYACFSSVVDDFITPFMPVEQYEEWRTKEYGRTKEPLDMSYKMPLKEALRSLSLNKTDDEIMNSMRDAGLFYRKEEE